MPLISISVTHFLLNCGSLPCFLGLDPLTSRGVRSFTPNIIPILIDEKTNLKSCWNTFLKNSAHFLKLATYLQLSCTGLIALHERCENIANKLFSNVLVPNHKVHKLLPPRNVSRVDLRKKRAFNLPLVRTNRCHHSFIFHHLRTLCISWLYLCYLIFNILKVCYHFYIFLKFVNEYVIQPSVAMFFK